MVDTSVKIVRSLEDIEKIFGLDGNTLDEVKALLEKNGEVVVVTVEIRSNYNDGFGGH